jgi:hypothetical protein
MSAIKAVSPTFLLAAAMWCLSDAANADDANAAANAQRIQTTIAAQSMLGYPPVADAGEDNCCCLNTAAAGYASATLQQQIASLSAALKQTPEPAKLSPAQLAEGAY